MNLKWFEQELRKVGFCFDQENEVITNYDPDHWTIVKTLILIDSSFHQDKIGLNFVSEKIVSSNKSYRA